jgi:Sec-independent protein translocase protein TatA
MAEAAVIAVVALVFLGPDKLPAVMRTLAKAYKQLARLRTEFSRAVEEGLGPELSQIKPEIDKLGAYKRALNKPLSGLLAGKAKDAVLGSAASPLKKTAKEGAAASAPSAQALPAAAESPPALAAASEPSGEAGVEAGPERSGQAVG